MSSSAAPAPTRRRGGTWRYAVPDTAGAGAAKFRDNLRRLGGGDLLPSELVPADGSKAAGLPAAGLPVSGRRPGRPRFFR